jgi:hypothetical protein
VVVDSRHENVAVGAEQDGFLGDLPDERFAVVSRDVPIVPVS